MSGYGLVRALGVWVRGRGKGLLRAPVDAGLGKASDWWSAVAVGSGHSAMWERETLRIPRLLSRNESSEIN
jgi:hypothetical protein